jgi:acyl dehydratase
MHYDQYYTREKHLPAPVVDGQVFGALLTELLQDALGPRCFVRELAFTFRNLMFAGETVRCAGTVTEVSADGVRVELTATILSSQFGPERAAAAPASALVLLGVADGPGS